MAPLTLHNLARCRQCGKSAAGQSASTAWTFEPRLMLEDFTRISLKLGHLALIAASFIPYVHHHCQALPVRPPASKRHA
jgi:hypothetical protein